MTTLPTRLPYPAVEAERSFPGTQGTKRCTLRRWRSTRTQEDGPTRVRNRHSTEQIIHKLRKAEVELANGRTVNDVCKQIGVTD